MKEYEASDRVLEAEQERFRRFFSCSMGSVFDLAAEPNAHCYCTVTQQGSGTIQARWTPPHLQM